MNSTTIKERPIIFSGDSPRLILEGRKTQTRRVDKLANELARSYDHCWVHLDKKTNEWLFKGRSLISDVIETFILKCPYGKMGNRLWVRETYSCENKKGEIYSCIYKTELGGFDQTLWKWTSPIFMPRFLSRILLEITEVRVERLQKINSNDCREEGLRMPPCGDASLYVKSYIKAYKKLWNSLNAEKYPWETNPWVWAITFKLLKQENTE